MRRRLNYLDEERESLGLGGLEGLVRGKRPRQAMRGTRFWSPDEALSRQPFAGFPGGRPAWESFKATGELPTIGAIAPTLADPLTGALGSPGSPGQQVQMSPEARDFYYNKLPATEGFDPASGLTQRQFGYDHIGLYYIDPTTGEKVYSEESPNDFDSSPTPSTTTSPTVVPESSSSLTSVSAITPQDQWQTPDPLTQLVAQPTQWPTPYNQQLRNFGIPR